MAPPKRYAKIRYDFTARNANELSVLKDEILEVGDHAGWGQSRVLLPSREHEGSSGCWQVPAQRCSGFLSSNTKLCSRLELQVGAGASCWCTGPLARLKAIGYTRSSHGEEGRTVTPPRAGPAIVITSPPLPGTVFYENSPSITLLSAPRWRRLQDVPWATHQRNTAVTGGTGASKLGALLQNTARMRTAGSCQQSSPILGRLL